MTPEAIRFSSKTGGTEQHLTFGDLDITTGDKNELSLGQPSILPAESGDTVTIIPDENGEVTVDGYNVQKVVIACGPYFQEIQQSLWQRFLNSI